MAKKWIGLQVGVQKYLINAVDGSAERFDAAAGQWKDIPGLILVIGDEDQVVFDQSHNILTAPVTVQSKGRYD